MVGNAFPAVGQMAVVHLIQTAQQDIAVIRALVPLGINLIKKR
jgi:hypothetical protein